jgi:hypothetical protein
MITRVFALFLLAFGVAGATFSYRALQDHERNSYLVSEPFKLGNSALKVSFDGKCLGIINLEFNAEGESHAFNANGKLRFEIGEKTFTPEIRSDAIFNELDQLGGSIVKILLPDLKMSFGTVNVDPLEFRFRMIQNGKEEKYIASIPGPIELRDIGHGSFALRYGFLAQMKDSLLKTALPGDLGLKVETVKQNAESCDLDGAPVNITPLFFRILKFAGQLQNSKSLPFTVTNNTVESF